MQGMLLRLVDRYGAVLTHDGGATTSQSPGGLPESLLGQTLHAVSEGSVITDETQYIQCHVHRRDRILRA